MELCPGREKLCASGVYGTISWWAYDVEDDPVDIRVIAVSDNGGLRYEGLARKVDNKAV
jgi:hypothetical protein